MKKNLKIMFEILAKWPVWTIGLLSILSLLVLYTTISEPEMSYIDALLATLAVILFFLFYKALLLITFYHNFFKKPFEGSLAVLAGINTVFVTLTMFIGFMLVSKASDDLLTIHVVFLVTMAVAFFFFVSLLFPIYFHNRQEETQRFLSQTKNRYIKLKKFVFRDGK